MMKIYKLGLCEITESDLNIWFDAMSGERKEEVCRLLNPAKRACKIAADRLCKTAVSEFCGYRYENIKIKKNEHGKPFAENLPIFFSMSHSGNFIVCAVSDNEIGIDIEKIRPINLKAAAKFATPEETDYINSSSNGFFEIWTLKEAYFKCIGTGLGTDIKKVSFEITTNKITCSDKAYNCSFADIESGYICSVCQKIN